MSRRRRPGSQPPANSLSARLDCSSGRQLHSRPCAGRSGATSGQVLQPHRKHSQPPRSCFTQKVPCPERTLTESYYPRPKALSQANERPALIPGESRGLRQRPSATTGSSLVVAEQFGDRAGVAQFPAGSPGSAAEVEGYRRRRHGAECRAQCGAAVRTQRSRRRDRRPRGTVCPRAPACRDHQRPGRHFTRGPSVARHQGLIPAGLFGRPFVDQFPLMGGEDDLVDFDDAPGGGAGGALDGDDSLVGIRPRMHRKPCSDLLLGLTTYRAD